MSARIVKTLAWVLLLLPILGAHAQTTVKYVHTDALGSVVAMTDAAGAVIETTREYEPYGLQLAPAIQGGPGYTGHVQDAATGLTYMQQRYYDPGIGRFLSVDPVTAYGGDNRYFNRYWYAAGNPYKYTDPDGRVLDTLADIGFIAYSGYKLATEPSWTNAAALGADIVGAAVPFATGLGAGVRAAANGAEAVAEASALTRAKEIHGALKPGTQGRVTTAVAETQEGVRVVGSSEGALRPAQRAAMKPGEVAAKGTRGTHAEVNAVNGARAQGLTPTSVSPSRPACSNCQQTMKEQNIEIKDRP